MNFFFASKQFIIFIFQSIINFIFEFIIIFNSRSNKIIDLLKNLKYKNFNKSSKNSKNNNIVIFEMFNINENIISFYLWSLVFKKKVDNCFVYPLKINSKFYNPIAYLIYKKLGFKILDWKLNFKQQKEVQKTIKKINFKKLNKKNFLNLKFRGIKVGDLIYDHHLRYKFLPTSEIDSSELIKTLQRGIEIVIFWDDYFKNNKVSSICYSHSCYLLGIPGRVAIKYNIDSLCISGNSVFRFNKKNNYLGDQFQDSQTLLKKFYKQLGKNNSKKLKLKYKKNFYDLMSGRNKNMIYTVAHSQRNTFKKIKKNRLKFDKTKFNILVSAHDFYEGPNTWGKFIFPDFYEWLNFLRKYIKNDKKKNRHWFIKPHPDGSDNQIETLNDLFKDINNVTILPKKITHSELIGIDINFALTARGSVTYQYTYFGINTLICSNIGLYKDFKFVIKSNSKEDYIKKLDNMEKISIKKPNMQDAINFFLMLNIFIWGKDKEFIFPDISRHLKKKAIYFNQAKADIYRVEFFNYIKKHLTENQLRKIFFIIEKFLKDKDQPVLDAISTVENNHRL